MVTQSSIKRVLESRGYHSIQFKEPYGRWKYAITASDEYGEWSGLSNKSYAHALLDLVVWYETYK